MSTASSSVGKEALSPSTGDTGSLDQKVEMAQKFDREMKDYAKATVKEFLGIYGYEEDVDMEESAVEGSQTERTTSLNSLSSTAITPENSQPSHEVTSNISSDCTRDGNDVGEDSPASILAYQSSGPISFAVVSACESPSESATKSPETIVSVHGKPALKSRVRHLRTLADRTHRISRSLSETSQEPQMGLKLANTLSEQAFTVDGSTVDSGSVVVTSASAGILPVSVDRPSGSATFTHIASRSRRDVGSAAQTTDSSSEADLSQDGIDLSEDSSKVLLQEKNRLRMRIQRCSESMDKRELRLQQNRERARQRRANEDDERRTLRLVKDRERQKHKRTHEVEAERAKRLLQQRMSARRRRSQETPEQKEARRLRDKERTRRYREAKRVLQGTKQKTALSTESLVQDANDTPAGSGTQESVDSLCKQGVINTPSVANNSGSLTVSSSPNKPGLESTNDSRQEAALRSTTSSLAKPSVQDGIGSVTEPAIQGTSGSSTKQELDTSGSTIELPVLSRNSVEVFSNLPAKACSRDTSGSPIQIIGTTISSLNTPIVQVNSPVPLIKHATQDASDTPIESTVKTTSGSPEKLAVKDVGSSLIMLATQAVSGSLEAPVRSSCSLSSESPIQAINCSPLKDVTQDSNNLPVVLSVQDESGSPLVMALHPSNTNPVYPTGNYKPFKLAIQNNSNSTIQPCVVSTSQPLLLTISPVSRSSGEQAVGVASISPSDATLEDDNHNDVKMDE